MRHGLWLGATRGLRFAEENTCSALTSGARRGLPRLIRPHRVSLNLASCSCRASQARAGCEATWRAEQRFCPDQA
eukprot:1008653-Pleurochrysis_carterae.AAC.1